MGAAFLLTRSSAPGTTPPPASDAPAAAPAEGAPVIVSPATGTVVARGQSVRVVVQSSATRVALVGPEGATVDSVAPFEFHLSIPATAAGKFPIRARADSGPGGVLESGPVVLTVLAASLQGVALEPREMILFGPGSTRSLSVLGTLSDGSTLDLTDPATGTVYAVDRPEIATVSPEGLVTAGSPGVAVAVARHGPHQPSSTVTVLPAEAEGP